MHHDTCVALVPWCLQGQGKRSRHSQYVRNPDWKAGLLYYIIIFQIIIVYIFQIRYIWTPPPPPIQYCRKIVFERILRGMALNPPLLLITNIVYPATPGEIMFFIMMTSSNERIFRVTGPFVWVTGEFPAQRPVTRSFDVFFDLRLNKRFSKQSWGSWFETPSCSVWRHCNDP